MGVFRNLVKKKKMQQFKNRPFKEVLQSSYYANSIQFIFILKKYIYIHIK